MTRTTRRRLVAALGVESVGAFGIQAADLSTHGTPAADGRSPPTAITGDRPDSLRWRTGPPMPDERSEVAAATLHGRLYVAGGFVAADGSDRPATADVAVFHPDGERWSSAERMPAARHHVGIAATDERVYVVGGFEGDFRPVETVWAFDGETWEPVRSLPTPRGALAVGLVHDRIHAVGGDGGDGALATHEVYDPEADSWSEAAPMPTAREHVAAGVVDGELYAIGGRVDGDNLATAERYDPDDGDWDAVATMPTPRSGLAATTLDGRIYAFGGESRERTFDAAEAYRPADDRWTTLDQMPTARHGLGAATLNGTVYVASGGPKPGFSYSDILDILERE